MIGETALVLAEIAASNEPLPARAQAMLTSIEQLIPFDSAWVALAEPQAWSYTSVASTALDGKTLDHLAGPVAAHDIELAGANRVRPADEPVRSPVSGRDAPDLGRVSPSGRVPRRPRRRALRARAPFDRTSHAAVQRSDPTDRPDPGPVGGTDPAPRRGGRPDALCTRNGAAGCARDCGRDPHRERRCRPITGSSTIPCSLPTPRSSASRDRRSSTGGCRRRSSGPAVREGVPRLRPGDRGDRTRRARNRVRGNRAPVACRAATRVDGP